MVEVLEPVCYRDLLSMDKDAVVVVVKKKVCGAERACLLDSSALCSVWSVGWGTDP